MSYKYFIFIVLISFKYICNFNEHYIYKIFHFKLLNFIKLLYFLTYYFYYVLFLFLITIR
jgi:hypothetical protein